MRSLENIQIEYNVKFKALLTNLQLIEQHEPRHPAVLKRCGHWLQQCMALTDEYKQAINTLKRGNNQS